MTARLIRQEPVLRVAINAQLQLNSGAGGIESVLVGLISALSRLDNGWEEYIVIGPDQETDWLQRHLGPNQRIVSRPNKIEPPPTAEPMQPLKRALGPLRPLVGRIRRSLIPVHAPLPQPPRYWPEISVSDGFYESLGCQVIHFPYQAFTLCSIPAVFNPHDLQHRHYPQFFTPQQIAWRESIYPAACHLANTVVVGSQWVKEDLLHHYRLDPEKIQVVPWAPPTQAYQDPTEDLLQTVQQKYHIERPFAFYPAVTWEHKNHVRLLEALAMLRDRFGVIVRLVCTGGRYPDYWPQIEDTLQVLNVGDQVQFLGMVSPEELRAIYRMAQFVIVPTLFEAASGPVFEAWQEGVPVACSAVTSLPEQAGNAALLFDPLSVETIADAILRMTSDEILRRDLAEKGRYRLRDFDWERTAKAYRAVYRRAARYPLTEEDRWLLSWDWMKNPLAKREGAL